MVEGSVVGDTFFGVVNEELSGWHRSIYLETIGSN
jgi:hypothetical protein